MALVHRLALVALALAPAFGSGVAFAGSSAPIGEPLAREAEREAPAPAVASDWCAPELEALPKDVCYFKGPRSKAGKRTLVIFLHGLVQEGSGWQYAVQKGMANAAKRYGFSLFAPRGRTSVGPGAKSDTIAWPTKNRAVEDEVIAEWMGAKAIVEEREGAPFDEVFVLGFSNGAHYATSLALRGRLDVDGYGVFAGGSAPKGTVAAAKSVKNKKPIFLGIASKDETSAKKEKELGKALKELKWPREIVSRPVGHTVADDHLELSLEYLRGAAKKKNAATTDDDEPAPKTKKKGAKKNAEKAEKSAPKAKKKKSASKKK